MKARRQCAHDPHYRVQKYDRYGNVRAEWKAAYEKKKKDQRNLRKRVR